VNGARLLRVATGVLVLLALAAIGVVLIPPYAANWHLQRYLNGLIDDPSTAQQAPDAIRAEVLQKAVSLGVPLTAQDVQITPSHNAIRIDALYLVHVDIAGYTVDLHFRPAAGGS
jgi:hypothetical protein